MNSVNKYLIIIIRIVLGTVFLWASFDKIIDPAKFARNISNYHVIPFGIENTIAIVLPWLELFIGSGLILGIMVDGCVIISSLLLIMFNLMIAQAIFRGFNIECGCGLKEGQLDNCPLTMRDLAKLKGDVRGKDGLLPVLRGIYHIRVEYPGTKKIESAPTS